MIFTLCEKNMLNEDIFFKVNIAQIQIYLLHTPCK